MNLAEINKRIVDRSDLFYWQAERRVTEEEAAMLWKDRHSRIKNSQLIYKVNECLIDDKCVSIDDVDPKKQEANGSVNSNRVGHLQSGKKVIIRCHPYGVENGYFYVESLVANMLVQHGLPAYHTYAIHDCENENDCAFQVIERIDGTNIENFLKENPHKEPQLVYEMGRTMAQIHKIKVDGFGPFSNELAKKYILKGVHKSLYDSVLAGLDFDLQTLVKYDILTQEKAQQFKKLFENSKNLLSCKQAVLVHNDFADWNLLTDGQTVNGILDFDECVASDPVTDIACWSLFFKPERLKYFLNGYFSIAKRPDNFEEKFQLLKLRYSLSKMTLRTRRYTYEPTEFMKNMIKVGKQSLLDGEKFFELENEPHKQ